MFVMNRGLGHRLWGSGLEPLSFLPPYDPESALSEPGSEEDWDALSVRTEESKYRISGQR